MKGSHVHPRFSTALALTLAFGACYEGGLNTNESTAGNKVGGAQLGYDLALSDDARFLVTRALDSAGQESVWAVDLEAFTAVSVPVARGAQRLVFGEGDLAYVLTVEGMDATGRSNKPWKAILSEASLTTGKVVRSWDLGGAALLLSIDDDRKRIAAWSNLPWNMGTPSPNQNALAVVDLETGEMTTQAFEAPVADARFLPGTGDLAVVTNTGNMTSRIVFLSGPDLVRDEVHVPNCASSLQVSPDGKLGMLAPTHCTKDPVSVIDLGTRTFVENLPGFGPVAFSPDGKTALAFGRQADLLQVAGIETSTPYSLLFIDVATLDIEVLELGADLPIYSITPDGQVVLVYSVLESSQYDGIVLIDIPTRTLRETTGPEVDLSEFVMTPDGQLVYLIDGGLYRLDVLTGMIEYVYLTCGGPGEPSRCNPDLVNLYPDGSTLVLGYFLDVEFGLWDVEASRWSAAFDIDVDAADLERPQSVL